MGPESVEPGRCRRCRPRCHRAQAGGRARPSVGPSKPVQRGGGGRGRAFDADLPASLTVMVLSQGVSEGFGSKRSHRPERAMKASWTTSSAVSRWRSGGRRG